MPEDEKDDLDVNLEDRPEDPLEGVLKKLGAKDVSELDEKIDALDKKNNAFQLQRLELRQLKQKLTRLESEREDQSAGVTDKTDPVVRELARKLSRLEAGLGKKFLLEDGEVNDDDYEDVLEQHPHLLDVKDQLERLKMAKTLALGLRAAKKASSGNGIREDSTRDKLARVHVERGGGSTPIRGGQGNEDDDLARYKRERESAGTDKGLCAKVDAKYRARYPNWGI